MAILTIFCFMVVIGMRSIFFLWGPTVIKAASSGTDWDLHEIDVTGGDRNLNKLIRLSPGRFFMISDNINLLYTLFYVLRLRLPNRILHMSIIIALKIFRDPLSNRNMNSLRSKRPSPSNTKIAKIIHIIQNLLFTRLNPHLTAIILPPPYFLM